MCCLLSMILVFNRGFNPGSLWIKTQSLHLDDPWNYLSYINFASWTISIMVHITYIGIQMNYYKSNPVLALGVCLRLVQVSFSRKHANMNIHEKTLLIVWLLLVESVSVPCGTRSLSSNSSLNFHSQIRLISNYITTGGGPHCMVLTFKFPS